MKGSASRPSSATMKGTRCAISPETNATSRESRSSLETSTAASRFAGGCESRRELRSPIERIGALAAFSFDVFGNDGEVFGFGEARDRRALGLDAEAGSVLLPCGDTIVGNSAFHTNRIPPFAVCMKSISRAKSCKSCRTATTNAAIRLQ